MTVQELIELLQMIEDKTKQARVMDCNGGWGWAYEVESVGNSVDIYT